MKAVKLWIVTLLLSAVAVFSVQAMPKYDTGLNFDSDYVVVEINTNEVKSLVSAPKTPVVVAAASKSQDKALIKLVSTQTMKTANIHVSVLSTRLFGSGSGTFISDRPDIMKNPRWQMISQWNKRPFPIDNS